MKIKTSALTLLGLAGTAPLFTRNLQDVMNAPEALWIAFWGIGLLAFSRALRARRQATAGTEAEPGHSIPVSPLAMPLANGRPLVAGSESATGPAPVRPRPAVSRQIRPDRRSSYARAHYGLPGSELSGGPAST
jgi:hypothetical protein